MKEEQSNTSPNAEPLTSASNEVPSNNTRLEFVDLVRTDAVDEIVFTWDDGKEEHFSLPCRRAPEPPGYATIAKLTGISAAEVIDGGHEVIESARSILRRLIGSTRSDLDRAEAPPPIVPADAATTEVAVRADEPETPWNATFVSASLDFGPFDSGGGLPIARIEFDMTDGSRVAHLAVLPVGDRRPANAGAVDGLAKLRGIEASTFADTLATSWAPIPTSAVERLLERITNRMRCVRVQIENRDGEVVIVRVERSLKDIEEVI